MESYDFTKETDYINEVQNKIDTLSTAEAKQVAEYINSIKEKTAQEQTSKLLALLHNAILPCIREYAEMTNSRLTIESNNAILIVTLENPCGFDITESCKAMKSIISFSSHIGIDIKEGNASLALIFGCTAP
ncbi:MAG: hypothetical protein E7244_04210 [Enterocloster citroniae]|nr:hypothetical protein [Enterocloster citroniae]